MLTTSHPALPAQTTAVHTLDALIPAAAAGDRAATANLVNRYTSLIRNVARGYRLTESDVEDVIQTVWMRCFQHLARLREPRALPGWLKTTAQHEALRLSTAQVRSTATDPADLERLLDRTGVADGSADLLRQEAGRVVRDGLAELSAAQRRLLILLHADAQPSYREISEALGIPQGSIGPTRARSLAKLRRTAALRNYLDAAGTAAGAG
jgi:RNA polymerase sigma factor (sigma-70 family)